VRREKLKKKPHDWLRYVENDDEEEKDE